jgi:hypothetical protein
MLSLFQGAPVLADDLSLQQVVEGWALAEQLEQRACAALIWKSFWAGGFSRDGSSVLYRFDRSDPTISMNPFVGGCADRPDFRRFSDDDDDDDADELGEIIVADKMPVMQFDQEWLGEVLKLMGHLCEKVPISRDLTTDNLCALAAQYTDDVLAEAYSAKSSRRPRFGFKLHFLVARIRHADFERWYQDATGGQLLFWRALSLDAEAASEPTAPEPTRSRSGPGSQPGPRPTKRDSVVVKMRSDIVSGDCTVASLAEEKQEALASRYGVNRETVRRALAIVSADSPLGSNPDK